MNKIFYIFCLFFAFSCQHKSQIRTYTDGVHYTKNLSFSKEDLKKIGLSIDETSEETLSPILIQFFSFRCSACKKINLELTKWLDQLHWTPLLFYRSHVVFHHKKWHDFAQLYYSLMQISAEENLYQSVFDNVHTIDFNDEKSDLNSVLNTFKIDKNFIQETMISKEIEILKDNNLLFQSKNAIFSVPSFLVLIPTKNIVQNQEEEIYTAYKVLPQNFNSIDKMFEAIEFIIAQQNITNT